MDKKTVFVKLLRLYFNRGFTSVTSTCCIKKSKEKDAVNGKKAQSAEKVTKKKKTSGRTN